MAEWREYRLGTKMLVFNSGLASGSPGNRVQVT